MILIFSIINESKNEIFQKFFVEKSYFSDLQIKTLLNSTSRLLNIVNLTSKTNNSNYSSRKFTITNLWLHIIKYNDFFYLFVTPTFFIQNNSPIDLEKEYYTLINQVDTLIRQCTSQKPYFDLIQNDFFQKNVLGLLTGFNKHLVKLINNFKKQNEPKTVSNLQNFYKDSKGKYLIVGTSSAGKSSIIAQFFSNWDVDQLKKIRPTINRELNSFKDSLVNHDFNIVDLGGQVQYTEMHLKDPNLFKNVNNLIYVIDVQDTMKIDFTKEYLLDIVDKMKSFYERPFIGIFLHKFDPESHNELYENVENWILWMEEKLSKLNIDYSYYLTSIKDNSAREAFARTLLLTLPYWFLALTIKEDLIIRSLNSLVPLINELNEKSLSPDDSAIQEELFNQSILFGFAATNLIVKKWINYLLYKDSALNADKKTDILDVSLEFNEKDSSLEMKFKCPLLGNTIYSNVINSPSLCQITHGVITGLSQFIGLSNVIMEETQIKNKTEFCKYKIHV